MWHSTWKRSMYVSLKRKSLILFKRQWNAPNADHCSVSTASKHSQPLWLRFPWEGIWSVNHHNLKQNHIILPSNIGGELLLTRQTYLNLDHLNALFPPAADQTSPGRPSVFLLTSTARMLPAEAKDYNRRDKTRNSDHRIKQSDGCGWKRIKKMLPFSFVTLVDVSLPATLSDCWGREQIYT